MCRCYRTLRWPLLSPEEEREWKEEEEKEEDKEVSAPSIVILVFLCAVTVVSHFDQRNGDSLVDVHLGPVPDTFLSQLAKAKARSVRHILRGRARQAWQHKWSSRLARAASCAFSLSLLDRRPAWGSDGATPSSSVVLSACRHVPLGSEV